MRLPGKTCLGFRSNEVRHELIVPVILHCVDFTSQDILDVVEVAVFSTTEHHTMPSLDQAADGL